MLLIPLLLCSSSSSVIKNEFKNGFDKQWTKKLLFLRLFSTILLISHSPLPLNYLRFHLKNRSYISKEIISLLKQRTQMKVISLHVTIFISNIEEYSWLNIDTFEGLLLSDAFSVNVNVYVIVCVSVGVSKWKKPEAYHL